MLHFMSVTDLDGNSIRKLRGIIQSVSVLTFISGILLKYYVDLCILSKAFQFLQSLERVETPRTSIDS
jgi:hypothetical protein